MRCGLEPQPRHYLALQDHALDFALPLSDSFQIGLSTIIRIGRSLFLKLKFQLALFLPYALARLVVVFLVGLKADVVTMLQHGCEAGRARTAGVVENHPPEWVYVNTRYRIRSRGFSVG